MFKNLVSQLSLSPSSAQGLAFYAKRLKQEKVTRTFSAVAAVLLVGLQFLTITVPSTSANASSPNDIIPGGITSKTNFVQIYNAPGDQGNVVRALMASFGITAAEVNAMTSTSINSVRTDGGTLRSIGHNAYGRGNEVRLNVPGATNHTFFQRDLKSFDSNKAAGSTYQALRGVHAGRPFYVLYACGNLTTTFTQPPVATPVPTPKPTPTPLVTPKPTPVVTPKPTPVPTPKPTPMPAPTFVQHKTAANLTQGKDATKQAANGGDLIQYTLTVTDTSVSPGSYTIADDITDILEYADVQDLGGGQIVGGGDSGTSIISWASANLKAGETVTRTFTVKVKQPVPTTPAGTSNPFSYDLSMDNVFGDTVHVPVTPPAAKQIEQVATTLPATGGPTSAMVVLLFAAFVLYFYSRNRQLVTEIKLLRGDYQGGVN